MSAVRPLRGQPGYQLVVVSPSFGRRFGQADEDVEPEVFFAEILDLFAFHDLDAAVTIGEGVAVLGDP
jgi:hypothetical protein